MYSRSHNEISFVGQILHRFYLQIWLPWFRCQSVPFTIISMYLLYPDSYSRCNNYNRRPPNNYIQIDTLFRYCPCSNLARIAGETNIVDAHPSDIYIPADDDNVFAPTVLALEVGAVSHGFIVQHSRVNPTHILEWDHHVDRPYLSPLRWTNVDEEFTFNYGWDLNQKVESQCPGTLGNLI